MFNIQDFALNVIQNNPQIAGNQNAKNLLDVIRSGDQKKGIEIANNLCATYGVNPDDAVAMAKQFFNIP